MDSAGTLVAVVGLGKGGRVAAPVPWLAVGRWGGLSEALSAMGGVLLITKGRGVHGSFLRWVWMMAGVAGVEGRRRA